MITCPLCNREVQDESRKLGIPDDSPQDFYCPTRHFPDNEFSRSHYYRVTCQGCFPEYTMHLPPFVLSWIEGKNELRIYNTMRKAATNSAWKFVPKVDFQELLHWVERLQTLRAFA